jgi:alcohol dehydrogenase class IV
VREEQLPELVSGALARAELRATPDPPDERTLLTLLREAL